MVASRSPALPALPYPLRCCLTAATPRRYPRLCKTDAERQLATTVWAQSPPPPFGDMRRDDSHRANSNFLGRKKAAREKQRVAAIASGTMKPERPAI